MSENKNIYCVIMAGGIGSRFWPMSTVRQPKQFHDVLGVGKTLIQQTYERLLKITSKDKIYVITDQQYTDITAEQLPELNLNQIIAEPFGMNTAPCNIYAAIKISKIDPEATLLVCPSDHLILDVDNFVEVAKLGLEKAKEEDNLYTLGITPKHPDTGYGYIQYVESNNKIKRVKTFTEKPNHSMAQKFLESGDFLWNAGIFIWNASSILKAFKKFLPEMYHAFESIQEEINTPSEFETILEVYPTLNKVSIDVGILEKAQNVKVIKSDFSWSDLGTWDALYDNGKKDKNNNVMHGDAITFYNSEGNLVYSEENKAIVIDGLENCIVVDMPNGLLITSIDKAQEVKAYVNDLRFNKKTEFI